MSAEFTVPVLGKNDSFAAYVHIPFCAARCGYCDFNTYTNLHFGAGANLSDFANTIEHEIYLSAHLLGSAAAESKNKAFGVAESFEPQTVSARGIGDIASLPHRGMKPQSLAPHSCSHAIARTHTHPLSSVFFGGGTPTMLPPSDLIRILDCLRDMWGIMPGAEITTEANPETVTPASLAQLKAGGFNRISFGMQSAVPHVLKTLDRKHTPGQVAAMASAARELGFEYSVDLIYGTPGESMDDWRASLDAAIALHPNHISAYALTIEPHTPMGRAIARGEMPEPDPDEQADKYEYADAVLSAAGYQWYEISNWARPGHESQHNVNYWREGNWWGYGPGAHSHIKGTRWWNVKHPIKYASALAAYAGRIAHADHCGVFEQTASPSYVHRQAVGLGDLSHMPDKSALVLRALSAITEDFEHLSAEEIREEQVLMGIRLREGIDIPHATDPAVIAQLIADGLIDPQSALRGRIKLSLRGRLLADVVTRALW